MLTARKTVEAGEKVRRTGGQGTMPSQTVRHDDVRATTAVHQILVRVEGEYREMPGLSLTLAQARRLWGLDHSTCELVLTRLIEHGVLKRAANGTYVRRQCS